jgi:BNR repeat protein
MRTSTRLATAGASILLILLPAAGASADPGGPHPLRVSGPSPFAGCTIGAGTNTTNYPNAEVEPQITTNRFHPDQVVGAWQQDRWNDGGAHGLVAGWSADGGRSFHEVPWPVSLCAPGGVNYQRASDPWVSTGPEGIVYGSAISFDETTARNAVVATTSYDGGRTWRNTTPLIEDTELAFFNDKNSVTADAVRPGRAYQVWDRLEFNADASQLLTGPAWMSVTNDGGRTWSPARIIVHTGQFQQTIGNVIVSDPRDGTLYDFYTSIQYTDATASAVVFVRFEVVRSFDAGRTWSTPSVIAQDTSVADVDPNDPTKNLRTGAGLPEPAVDPRTGELYVAYEGSDFTAGAYNQIQLVHSTDRGRTWSAPVRVNGDPTAPAYTPTVAVAANGAVGVTYYDIRTLRPGNTTTLPTSTWLAVSPPGGTRFGHERQIAPVFDFLSAPNAGGFFLGDYQGLTAVDGQFRALFVTANSGQPNNRTDVFYQEAPAFARPSDATDTAPSAALAAPATAGAQVLKPALAPQLRRR